MLLHSDKLAGLSPEKRPALIPTLEFKADLEFPLQNLNQLHFNFPEKSKSSYKKYRDYLVIRHTTLQAYSCQYYSSTTFIHYTFVNNDGNYITLYEEKEKVYVVGEEKEILVKK